MALVCYRTRPGGSGAGLGFAGLTGRAWLAELELVVELESVWGNLAHPVVSGCSPGLAWVMELAEPVGVDPVGT